MIVRRSPFTQGAWLSSQSVYLFILLMLIACLVIAKPDWPARGLELLLVVFACAALLYEKRLRASGSP